VSIERLIQVMREEGSKFNPSLPMIGKVISESPLMVNSNNITFDSDQLYVVHTLMPDEVIKLTPTGTQYESTYQLKTPFKKGQEVVLLPTTNKDKFIVLRVVK
jgi:hypothetical protein